MTEVREIVESELVARLDGLSLMASRSPQKIESSTFPEQDRAEALLLIKQSVESSRKTIRQLTCQNKLGPPELLSARYCISTTRTTENPLLKTA